MIAPDDDTLPPPLTTLTTPPVFALSVVLPADKYMWPPAPLVVEPTVNDIEPAAPAVATPVAIDT